MNRIILPLDNLSWDEALPIMRATRGFVWGYKVRKIILEMGIDIIPDIKEFGNVMVDFKLYDIPSAISESLKLHFEYSADISTIHCTAQYLPDVGVQSNKIAGVTILTSFSQEISNYYKDIDIKDLVYTMTIDAYGSNFGYVVCSPLELIRINELAIKKITPGIRPEWYSTPDDQNRVSTPSAAIKNGADLLVIGRPLLRAENIADAIKMTNDEINSAL